MKECTVESENNPLPQQIDLMDNSSCRRQTSDATDKRGLLSSRGGRPYGTRIVDQMQQSKKKVAFINNIATQFTNKRRNQQQVVSVQIF
jgi:hypothetical protein